jgi:tetratricopeptide (TPR) repeat protein
MGMICETAIETDEVLLQLGRILSDKRFAGAERTARFLRYVVERTLAGAASEIKEIVIATDLYERSIDYDPKVDSVVRVEASRVRSKLATYYQEQGSSDPILITIPKGSYVPQFERREPMPSAVETSVVATFPEIAPQPAPVDVARRWSLASLLPWIVLVGTCSLALFVWISPVSLARPVVANAVPASVSPEAIAAWEEATNLMLQDPHSAGIENGTPQPLLRAIDRLEYAVAESPSFARAWASLAEAYEYAFAYVGRNPAADAKRAECAARKAVALDKKLPMAHANLALVLFYLRWDFAGAEAEYRRAIDLDPRLSFPIVEYADLLRETGRFDQAEAEIRKARALLPAVPVLAWKQSEIALDRNQTEDAVAAATAAIQLKRNYGRSYVARGSAYEGKGLYSEAVEQYRVALAIDKLDRRALPSLGYLLARTGRKQEASVVLQQLLDMNARIRNCAFQVAVVYTGLGDHERALDWLERAYATRQMHVPFMGVEYRFQPLRQHPRFRAILSRVGLRIPT